VVPSRRAGAAGCIVEIEGAAAMHVAIATENPLWPAAYDGVWNFLIATISISMLLALIDVMRTATPLRAVEWVALIVLVPVLGPAIWFVYGRRRFDK
jgi:hypothetical protein